MFFYLISSECVRFRSWKIFRITQFCRLSIISQGKAFILLTSKGYALIFQIRVKRCMGLNTFLQSLAFSYLFPYDCLFDFLCFFALLAGGIPVCPNSLKLPQGSIHNKLQKRQLLFSTDLILNFSFFLLGILFMYADSLCPRLAVKVNTSTRQ